MNADNILFIALDIFFNQMRINYVGNNFNTLKVQVKAKQQKNIVNKGHACKLLMLHLNWISSIHNIK
jgi:hypothetical protein